MKWRVMLELIGPDGTVVVHEVGGRAAVAEYAPRMIGLTLEEGKHLLAALQVHLVQAQAEDHSRRRRWCQRCGAQRPLKDQRSRRLVGSFTQRYVKRHGPAWRSPEISHLFGFSLPHFSLRFRGDFLGVECRPNPEASRRRRAKARKKVFVN
jgi:hypothetical protein